MGILPSCPYRDDGQEALHEALKSQSWEMCDLLIEKGVSAGRALGTLLAIGHQPKSILEYLFPRNGERGRSLTWCISADPDRFGGYELFHQLATAMSAFETPPNRSQDDASELLECWLALLRYYPDVENHPWQYWLDYSILDMTQWLCWCQPDTRTEPVEIELVMSGTPMAITIPIAKHQKVEKRKAPRTIKLPRQSSSTVSRSTVVGAPPDSLTAGALRMPRLAPNELARMIHNSLPIGVFIVVLTSPVWIPGLLFGIFKGKIWRFAYALFAFAMFLFTAILEVAIACSVLVLVGGVLYVVVSVVLFIGYWIIWGPVTIGRRAYVGLFKEPAAEDGVEQRRRPSLWNRICRRIQKSNGKGFWAWVGYLARGEWPELGDETWSTTEATVVYC